MSVLDVGCGTGAITKGIIVPDGSGISDVTSPGDTRVFADRAGESAAPMDITLSSKLTSSAGPINRSSGIRSTVCPSSKKWRDASAWVPV